MIEEPGQNATENDKQEEQPVPPEAEVAPEASDAEPSLPSEENPVEMMMGDVHTSTSEIAQEEKEPATEELQEEELPPEEVTAQESAEETSIKEVAAEEAEAKEEETPEPEEAEEKEEKPLEDTKKWYVVKVQSGREESIKEAIERRVKIEGLEEYFGEILIPVEKEKIMVKGKRVERERKLYPGYIMARVDYNDQILYLFRETSGVGDFVGGGPNQKPLPMTELEVARMQGTKVTTATQTKVSQTVSPFSIGDHVRVKNGVFTGMEGDVKEVLEAKDQVRIELFVLGRPVPVELEYWEVEAV